MFDIPTIVLRFHISDLRCGSAATCSRGAQLTDFGFLEGLMFFFVKTCRNPAEIQISDIFFCQIVGSMLFFMIMKPFLVGSTRLKNG